jgi:ABC-type dipeptide/oligopeptide/nickel transport system ATPase component
LDVSVQARVLDLIDERAAATGAAVLFISHDLAVVASICDYLLVMWGGRIVERGTVVQVLADPQHEHTRRLLADADLTLAPGAGRTP